MSDTSPPPVALRTYMAIRIGVVAVIAALGFAVWRDIANSTDGCVQRSLSAYYYTPVRPVFVGALLIIGFAMIVMWGKTWLEDAALNLAGLLLTVVALVPTLDANYCSLPKAVRGQVPDSETKRINDTDLINANAEAVARSFSALLVVVALILVFIAVAAVLAYRSAGDRPPTTQSVIAYAVTWVLSASALVFYFVLFLDADDPESAFNHQVHGWSANVAVGLIIFAVILAAREKAGGDGPADKKWVRWYGFVAGAMVFFAILIKGGDALGLFSSWEWVDAHATFLVEAVLIALIGVFWVLQTIDRRKEGAPTY